MSNAKTMSKKRKKAKSQEEKAREQGLEEYRQDTTLHKYGGNKVTAESMGVTGVNQVGTFMAFAEWMAKPLPERKEEGLESVKAFAKHYKINRSTLYLWKKKPDFWKRVESLRQHKCREHTSTVIHKLYLRILRYGMAQDVELWLAYVEGWDKKQVIEERPQLFQEGDLRELVKKLPAEKREEFEETITRLLIEVHRVEEDPES